MKHGRMAALAVIALILGLIIAGCGESGDGTDEPPSSTETTDPGDTAPEEPEDTTAPEEPEDTTAPEEPEDTTPPEDGEEPEDTTPPEDGEEPEDGDTELEPGDVPLWAWIATGVVVIAAIVWMVRSGGGDTTGPDDETPI
jgi:hypothetical protein